MLRILSELVRSYAGCAKIVTQHIYKAGEFYLLANQWPEGGVAGVDSTSDSTNSINQPQTATYTNPNPLTEDCNALAFMLDNLLAANQTFGDKDCPSLCRLLIVALASCNHCLESQTALVHEVKQGLARAIQLPESSDKHIKVQAFASIINTMIETCPPIHNAQQQPPQPHMRNQPQSPVNNMMKIMHKKSLINDLARVPLHMDLACVKCIETINTILKPLETLTKTLNISVRKSGGVLTKQPSGLRLQAGNNRGTTPRAAIAASVANAQQQVSAAVANASSASVQSSLSTHNVNNASLQIFEQQQQQQVEQVQEQQHSGATSDLAGINLAADSAVASDSVRVQHILSSSSSATATASVLSNELNQSGQHQNVTSDQQMVDLNLTEMEPQQTLPQDVDMLPASSHHHHHHSSSRQREREERVFDRVIEVLNQEVDTDTDEENDEIESSGSDEYESAQNNRIIHIEADNEGDRIHIQIEAADEDEDNDEDDEIDEDEDDNDDELDLPGGDGVAASAAAAVGADANSSMAGGNETGEADASVQDDEDDDLDDMHHQHHHHRHRNHRNEDSSSNDDDEDDSSTDDEEDDDDDDEDDDVIDDDELVGGSDGRSAESESDEEHHHHHHHHRHDLLGVAGVCGAGGVSSVAGGVGESLVAASDVAIVNSDSNLHSLLDGTTTVVTAGDIAANGGVVTTSAGDDVVTNNNHRRGRRRRRHRDFLDDEVINLIFV